MPEQYCVEHWTPSYCATNRLYNKVSSGCSKPVMHIYNNTDYRTDDLRKLFFAAIYSIGDISRVWYITIGYRYSKKIGNCHGWAYSNTGRFHISLPNRPSSIKMKELCQIIQHEIDHCLGLNHSEMLDWWDLKTTWSKDLGKPRKN